MRYFYLFIGLLFSGLAQAQFTTNVYWTEQTSLPAAEVIFFKKNSLLNWKDFLGRVPSASSPAAAMTASGFGYKADVKNTGSTGQLNIGVYCYFNKQNSWVKEGKDNVYILNHEQNHFNISYLAANIFIEKVKAASFNHNNYNTLIPRIYTETCEVMNRMQSDYDGQTKNGQLKELQQKWDDFLSKKLSSLKD